MLQIKAIFYENFFSDNVVTTEFLTFQRWPIEFVYDLNDFSYANFTLPYNTDADKYNRVEMFVEQNWTQERVFTWYVFSLNPNVNDNLNTFQVNCKSEKEYLNSRVALSDISTSWQSIVSAINSILQPYIDNGENWQVFTDITETVDVEVGTWEWLFDVISDFADQVWAQREVEDAIIRFKTRVGIDRTAGVWFKELSWTDHTKDIKTPEITNEAREADVVVAWDWNTTIIFPGILPDNIRRVVSVSFNSGNLSKKAEEYYNNINQPYKIYKITPEEWDIGINIGDLIPVRIEWLWERIDTSLNLTVTKKQVLRADWINRTSYELSEGVISRVTTSNVIKKIQRDISILQNR